MTNNGILTFTLLFVIIMAVMTVVMITDWSTDPAEEAKLQATHDQEQKEFCTVKLVATSPDGVNLWRLDRRCDTLGSFHDVYWSGRGASTSVPSGKTSIPVDVPNGDH
jgi:hypothetical protein